ncbi:hypothetical protein K5D51_02635 [Pseudomonas cichorii]|nr:hypothetical protein [Pseudomonas cichorii]MBX8578469.1 hypothetical protein [Pseudomonas cichorii]
MKTLSIFTNIIASLGLFACVSAQAITGPETVQLLNNRYQSTASTCANEKPAWQCSGVLVQAAARQAGQMFWHHNANATALGAEGLVYLRSDVGIRQLPQPNGVIFSDLFTAIGDGKQLEILCAYPLTQGLDNTRGNHGCALPVRFEPSANDVSSCSALGVTDAATWLTHFQQQGSKPGQQCSLSSLDPLQFIASLQAHEMLGSPGSAQTNQLQLKNWDPSTARDIPVQALFYDIDQAGALSAAQKDQRDYFNATGQWLTVVRMDLQDNSPNVFGFNLQDQLYVGYEIASRLNQRYQDTAPQCRDDKAAYFCNGVLIRGADATPQFHAWNPSPNSVSRNGVSFSYLRADVGTLKLAGNHGFIIKESFAPAIHPVTLRCSYPVNASTSIIPDSCRESCLQQGIVTVEGWRARYASTASSSCAFTPSPAQFQLNINVRNTLGSAKDYWNELIIAAWPQDIPEKLPLEGFFYSEPQSKPHAQFIQADYFKTTGNFLPVIRATLANHEPFVYELNDQLSPGTPGLSSRALED